ncbi:hypothetical protein JHK82_041464 [Glycine max]|nr:hypothetical protein JHK82_041464 [Glycine max]
MEASLKLESLACIDSTTLSHSELLALSLSSLCSTHDLLTPKIDPALFNQSTGSHRQTYSLPHSSPTARRRRLAGLLPSPKLPPLPAHDPENAENRLIIDYLKQFIRDDPNFDQVELAPPSLPQPRIQRKRGRNPKVKVHLDDCYRGIDIVNQNGVSVDLQLLANSQDPFAEELKRRTEGLHNEEELLGFLRDLPGQWGSRRKKRRIVDSADFGDVLPLSWKILLGLKRKDGRAWIYCRRYIRFSSSFLTRSFSFLAIFVPLGLLCLCVSYSPAPAAPVDSILCLAKRFLPICSLFWSAAVTKEHQDEMQIVAVNMAVSGLSAANERVKEVALLGIENLADVQIHDLLECRKCNMSFNEKDLYLQHLLSFHQRTTRRYRLGSSVGDGVIIKDGKFECQFCHKVFLERRRYNGHVGIHVRNYVRKVEDSPGQPNVQGTDDKSPVREDFPLRISKMDALIEIAQNSIMEDTVTEPHSSAKLNRIPGSDAVGYLDQDGNSESPVSEQQMEDSMTGKNVDHDLDEKVKDDVPLTIEELDQSGMDLDDNSQNCLLPLSEHHIIPESEKSENSVCANTKGQFILDEGISNKSELEFSLNGLKDVPVTVSTNVQEMVRPASEENVVHSWDFNSSISTEQSLGCLPAFNSDEGGKQFCSVDHEHDNVKGFQELRFDEIDIVENQLTTVCVWCGIEFDHDAVNSEIQPDSVGFMCPASKAKISGQVNVLDCGSPNAGCL